VKPTSTAIQQDLFEVTGPTSRCQDARGCGIELPPFAFSHRRDVVVRGFIDDHWAAPNDRV
jgi:hypothetical protein